MSEPIRRIGDIDRCCDCGKLVMHKPFLGTLHVCLSKYEKAEMEHLRWQVRQQRAINAKAPRHPFG